MQLIESFVRNPVKVSVGILLVVLFGVIALQQMPKQLTPEVQTPTISIETRWPGASPQEVEREIVQEQEEQLKSVEGVTKMSSESKDSEGVITLEFLVGTDMGEALLKVNSRLQQVSEYPEDSDEPVITTANASDRPIAWFILSAKTPDAAALDAFEQEHPELEAKLAPVRRIENAGLVLLKLRMLAEEDPAFRELLPPEDLDVSKLRRFAENHIEARFERVSGVANSNVLGGREDELQVILDPAALAARNLTIADVRRVLRDQNQDTSGGDFWEGKRRWVVRTLGQFDSPQEVEEQLLATRSGNPVYVRDVAEVRIGHKKPDGLVRRFGTTCIAVNVQRETGANVLDVMVGLRDVNRQLNEGILPKRGLALMQVYDETDYINSSIDLVQQNILIGGALTMIVLMLFLHGGVRTLMVVPFILISAVAAAYPNLVNYLVPFEVGVNLTPWFLGLCLCLVLGAGVWFARGALVVGMAIPTSIIGAFLMLGIMQRSLNVVSLAGMAFAVGMLVDNAVVVLENVYRHYQLGVRPFAAAVRGTKEVWGAVVSSTLTTIAVFLPVLFVEEEAGQLFRDIALAISSGVGLSLIVSITLIPMASARLFGSADEQNPTPADGTGGDGRDAGSGERQRTTGPTEGDGRKEHAPVSPPGDTTNAPHGGGWGAAILHPLNSFSAAFVRSVVGVNAWIQGSVLRRLVTIALLVGTAVGVSYAMWPKVEYLPTGNRNLVFGILLPPPGYNMDELMEIGSVVERGLKPYWDVDPNDPATKDLEYPAIRDFFFVARDRQVFMGVKTFEQDRVRELIPLVRQVGAEAPGTIVIAKQSSLFEQGLDAGRTIDIEITGPDLPTLVDLGRDVMMQITGSGPFAEQGPLIPDAQARPVPSLDLSSPEVHVKPRLFQASQLEVDTSQLGYTVDALVDGAYASDYYIGGDKIDLTIIGRQSFASHTQDVAALPVATPTGQLVPLGTLADVQLSSGPEQINHRERLRAVTVQVTPPAGVALEDAMQQIDRAVVGRLRESGDLGDDYIINLAGTSDKLRDTWKALRFNVLLALLITYLLMAALFESWLYPFVIILTVPLGAVGGILGLSLLNQFVLQPLDVLTMLGFVILIGTVVNNPILIVHQSLNHIRDDDMPPREAILESVRTRIRPIFMTTSTTVLGLLPLVLNPGPGSELYRGLGSVVLGGLIVSALFTLVLVPTVFSLTMEIKVVLVRLLWGRQPREAAPAAAQKEEHAVVS